MLHECCIIGSTNRNAQFKKSFCPKFMKKPRSNQNIIIDNGHELQTSSLSCYESISNSEGKGKGGGGSLRCPNDLVTTMGTCNKKGAHAKFCQRSWDTIQNIVRRTLHLWKGLVWSNSHGLLTQGRQAQYNYF